MKQGYIYDLYYFNNDDYSKIVIKDITIKKKIEIGKKIRIRINKNCNIK